MISIRELGIRRAIIRGNTLITNTDRITQEILDTLANEIIQEVKYHMLNDTWVNAKGKTKQGHIESGELLSSIIKEQGNNYIAICIKARHAIFHEFGTSKQRAHPIFSSVINSKLDKIRDVLVEEYRLL
jgi:HK97 gp10 family phage protein